MADDMDMKADPFERGQTASTDARRSIIGVDNSGVKHLQSELIDIDPDALREAERVFAQGILDTMPGKSVARASYEETRVVLTMTDGTEYYFYGFLGESGLR
ncbi:MAG TPA: hypothetical protein VGX02_04540 [Candidatus Eremiobacteraceae bacterium]|jgi:hypothetical protein|nr:hypothetical protein [Candidatus Eremiobacteraceae bacterium]